jgi:hypothetical protein
VLICFCIPLVMFPLSIFRTDKYIESTDENTETNLSFENSSSSTDKIFTLSKNNRIGPVYKSQTDDSTIVPNEKLVIRNEHKIIRGIYRVYEFINAPLVKYINHLVNLIIFSI